MRRSSQQQPRNQALTVKLSASEKAAIQSAATQRQLSLAAYVADTALAAAEGRTVPVDDTEREMLRELMRVGNLLSWCRTQLAEATARQEATGGPGPDLESVAACCKQAGARADDVAIKLSRTLRRRTRLFSPASTQSGATAPAEGVLLHILIPPVPATAGARRHAPEPATDRLACREYAGPWPSAAHTPGPEPMAVEPGCGERAAASPGEAVAREAVPRRCGGSGLAARR
jgi:hypothetical protein